MELREALELLKPLFADRSILKIFHNVKYDLGILDRYGVEVNSIDDTLLLSYALDGPQFNTMSELSEHWLGHAGIPIKELIGSGKTQKTFAEGGDRRCGEICRRGRRPDDAALARAEAAARGRER